MRSKSSGMTPPTSGVLGVPQGDHDMGQEQDVCRAVKSMKAKVHQQEGEDKVEMKFGKKQLLLDSTKSGEKGGAMMNLSREDMLKLLGIMEGEVQAREDVISMLKSKQTPQDTLSSANNSAKGSSALQALQRDDIIIGSPPHNHIVYQKPMIELEHLQEKHRETYRRMLGQLLLAEKSHRRTVHELDSEKRKHIDYMNKSDDFTNLLEQERERLKRLLDNEKAFQVKKEKEHSKRLAKVQEELVKLKSFALMLVNERQQHLEQMDQQSQRVQELSQQLHQQKQIVVEAREHAQEDAQRVLSLEADLKEKNATLAQQHEETNAKLASQELLNRQLNSKIVELLHTVDELKESNKALRKSEDELQEMRDKIGKGECANSNLITELENLRKRVLEMEGNDEEITKIENQCKELRKKLQEEDIKSKELRLEVEKLQKIMIELEKLKGAFTISKNECSQLGTALEKEKCLSKKLSDEVVTLKIRMKELESSELKLEKSELNLKDDLGKLKSLTVALMEERKILLERMTSGEKTKADLSTMVKAEQSKVMEVTEKLIEESKKLLKLKSEMETKVEILTNEKGDISTKLAYEADKTKDLLSKVSQMKKRLDGLEQAERLPGKNAVKCEQGRISEVGKKDDNKIKELTFEIEHLRNRLKQLEVVEGDLIKTEDQYDILEKRFLTEQDKANILSQQVEAMRSQIARNKAIEKGEEDSQEDDLRQQYKREEIKNRELQSDVLALKEKIHELMHKEDQLSQLQVDYSVLQQRFFEEEQKAKNIGTEVLHLTKELEIAKRHSRALRPSLNGRRMVDIAVTSTGIQTEALCNGPTEDDTPAGFIRKSVQEENHIMNNLRQKSMKKPTEKTRGIERSPSSGSELSVKKSWIPWMRKKDTNSHETILEKTPHITGNTDMTMAHKPGQPLHIRVTPDHQNNIATLEISSTTAGGVFSTSTPLNPNTSQSKSRITIIPAHSAATLRGKSTNAPQGPERTKSPVTITTISRAKSPDSSLTSSSTIGRPMSPVTIMTVNSTTVQESSTSLEPQEMTMGRAVFKVTPEKQMVPMPIRKGHNNTSIITTTDDNKIHIHLGNNLTSKMVVRPASAVTDSKELTLSTGTVLRSPRQISTTRTTQNKVMSSITISPVSSNTARPTTQSMCGQDAQASRTGLTRIPMSKSLKTGKAGLGSLGISSGVKTASRVESQSMKIEVKK
ncbi:filamin-A-interacting protein 1-like isoform X1 [Entelurus aequoreus]|uniref:filamin-A-interacting protein 1-like isoform X1 n=2 Tax=Entelurus aequoreus TaxID=161455 RepID=UPI002B1E5869|nr:filamin-A-interacting protein 1-like isoform X1 [Entelurus aequoreus]XP_061896503.1 filamin-A-interacting protein 1-like isoform X1 [Entelurus aequoreus]